MPNIEAKEGCQYGILLLLSKSKPAMYEKGIDNKTKTSPKKCALNSAL